MNGESTNTPAAYILVEVEKIGPDNQCKGWAIVELQGELETRNPVPLNGKFIGDLHFTHKDAPVLIIGHHILHGKVLTLEKPYAVMSKITGKGSSNSEDGSTNQDCTKYHIQAVIKKKILFKTRPKPIIAHVPKKL